MKKLLFVAAVAALSLSSCSTVSHTAATENVDTQIMNRSTANLKVSDKVISYTFVPDGAHNRAGMKSMKAAAVQKALEANGNGDVLIAPQFEVKTKSFLFWKKVKAITVKGHPAVYNDVHNTTQAEADVASTLNGVSRHK
ncbi:MAG: hypothetical protein Q4F07_06990 [Bacteroidales bacterium]|nr:hypothetical protein [Bacteroidales bacterium]